MKSHQLYFVRINLTLSVSALVANKLSRMKRGVPFSIENFYSLGTTTSVQKAMSRLTKEGQVARVAKGIYSRPKPLASIPSIKITAKAEEVAKTWARTHKYKIAPQGLEAAYRLGMQTQAPVKTVYWTTGPSREFHVGNEIVQVKHTTETKLQWINKPEGALFRGLLSLSPEHTPVSTLHMAIKRLNLQEKEAIQVLQKLSNSPVLKMWKYKLNQLESSLRS
ncbi:DUF6088 family protein [Shewanella sp.]|uniref:DUF6088 family protein n=1 Tax=Shewanella sp. TaxID=50422 RepID=UPI0025D4B9FC|nr:DUF6088 family protein [Shewanella sp.]